MKVWFIILVQVYSIFCFPSNIGYVASNVGATSYQDTVFVAGGNYETLVLNYFQSINFTDGSQVSAQMEQGRLWASLVQVDDWVIVVGGALTVEMYSISQQKFIPSNHSFSTLRTSVSAVSLGSLAFFAGGNSADVEIYNAGNNSWSLYHLDNSSVEVGATVYKDLVLFLSTGRFYTFNSTSNQWNITVFPVGPATLGITVGTKGYFVGTQGMGFIYDFEENSWENLTLPYTGPYILTPLGDFIIFGPVWQPTAPFSIFNTTSQSWEGDYLPSQYRGSYSAATVKTSYAEIALIIAGFTATNAPSNVMDEYSFCSVNSEYLANSSYLYCSAALDIFTSSTTVGASTTGTGQPTTDQNVVFIAIAGAFVVLLSIVVAAVYLYLRKKKTNDNTAHYSLLNVSISQPTILKDVRIDQLLGRGQFSEVYSGMWNSYTPVAIKKLKSLQSKDEFEREAGILCSLNHPNCVRLYGIYEKDGEKMMVMEYLPMGDLSKLLRESNQFSYLDLLKMAQHIINGMCYLTNNHILHRDLALRNILVTNQNEGKYTAKVSDFGLSRYEDSGYYTTENRTMAVKWAALESVQYGKFSSKSDVWSFGVCLWELMSHGKIPFAGMLNDDVIHKITNGYRLPCPENCPNEIYEVMLSCWNVDPSQRPSFSHLAQVFSGFVQQHSQTETVMSDVIEADDTEYN